MLSISDFAFSLLTFFRFLEQFDRDVAFGILLDVYDK